MIIEYAREPGTNKPYGCVVCTDDGVMGWSVCSWRDRFIYHRARQIAEGRARKGRPLSTNKIPVWCRIPMVSTIMSVRERYEKTIGRYK